MQCSRVTSKTSEFLTRSVIGGANAFLLAAPLALSAQQGGGLKCQVESLTNRCNFFREQGREDGIKFPDGSFLPNPLKQAAVRTDYESSRKVAELRAQAGVMRALQNIDAPKISPLFIVAIGGSLNHPTLLSALDQSSSSKHHEARPLLLPWPPTDDGAQMRKVSADDLRAFLSSLKASDRTDLVKAISAAQPMAQSNSPNVLTAPRRAYRVSESVLEQRKIRARELFEEAKALFLDEIKRGRAYENLLEYERNQYQKVKSVRLKSFDAAGSDPSCGGFSPDAFYSPRTHSVTLCENYISWPDASLIEVLGHELAHAIDPCNQQFPVISINKEKTSGLSKSGSELPDEIRNSPDRLELLTAVRESEGVMMNLNEPMMGINGKEAFDFIKGKGYFDVVAQGIPFQKSPLSRAYSCLIKDVGIRELSEAQLQSIGSDYIRSIEEASPLGKKRKELASSAVQKLKRYPQCIRSREGKTQVQEAMSDLWSAKVLGRWLTRNPPKSKDEQIAALATFITDYCSGTSGKPEKKSAQTNPYEIVDLATRSAESAHPASRLRADAIHLTEPRIQKALGCADAGAVSCTKYLGTQSPSLPAARTESPETSKAVK